MRGAVATPGKRIRPLRLAMLFIAAFLLGELITLYRYPRSEFSRTWQRIAAQKGANTWHHVRDMADEKSDWIVRPNNDTLYSYAALDLSQGPVVVQIPPVGKYWSVQVIRDNTDVVGYAGSRVDGLNTAVTMHIGCGPGSAAAAGRRIIVPTCQAWLVARLLTEGKHDLPRVHALQDRMQINQPAAGIR